MFNPNPETENPMLAHVLDVPREGKLGLVLFFAFLMASTVVVSQELQVSESVDDFISELQGQHKYVSLKENKVYDVEIIVFAYLNEPLPNYKTYSNKPIFDDSKALTLLPKPEDLDLMRLPELVAIEESTETKTNDLQNTDKYTLNIENDEQDLQVLAWYEHDESDFKLSALWQRLEQNSELKPLLHKSWRIAETPFENPTYIKLSNWVDSGENNSEEQPIANVTDDGFYANNDDQDISAEENNMETEPLFPDFTVRGMLALSQGRFMHFGHQLNLMRVYNANPEGFIEDAVMKNMVFSLQERRQLKTDELNYYDTPWFGSIVKITEYTGEFNEEND